MEMKDLVMSPKRETILYQEFRFGEAWTHNLSMTGQHILHSFIFLKPKQLLILQIIVLFLRWATYTTYKTFYTYPAFSYSLILFLKNLFARTSPGTSNRRNKKTINQWKEEKNMERVFSYAEEKWRRHADTPWSFSISLLFDIVRNKYVVSKKGSGYMKYNNTEYYVWGRGTRWERKVRGKSIL